jgi:molybdate transport system ATP-binding protein
MDTVRLHLDIEKRLTTFTLQVRLEVGGEILVLFGPSGAGKTQTLHAIAGLQTPDAGEIIMDGIPFFRRHRPGPAVLLPARQRRVGYVFQQYALFPHLTALENVAYPLWRRPGADARARALLDQMHLGHLAAHYPHQLSGGQQQRVAIARALAADVRMLLLDEPFSALDRPIRDRLHQDLRVLQAATGLVVLYVTHSLEDAFAVGHRLAVLREGRIAQVGPLDTVFHQPNSPAVVEALGIPNIFTARVVAATPAGLVLDWDGLLLEAPPQLTPVGAQVTAYIRAQDIKILYPDRPLTTAVLHNRVAGQILRRHRGPGLQTLQVALPNGHNAEVAFPSYAYTPLALEPGDTIQIALRKEGLVILHPTAPDAPPPDSAQAMPDKM